MQSNPFVDWLRLRHKTDFGTPCHGKHCLPVNATVAFGAISSIEVVERCDHILALLAWEPELAKNGAPEHVQGSSVVAWIGHNA